MTAGPPAALHLAAHLLALAAAVGLGAIALGGRTPAGPSAALTAPDARAPGARTGRWLVAAGGFALALGHALEGALLGDRGPIVGWLLAAGLVAVAVGSVWDRLPRAGGALVAVPLAPVAAAAVGAAAGVAGGIRALMAGRSGLLAGVGLCAWGAAQALAAGWPTAAAVATLAGAVALGGWVWQASAARLLSRVVTTFVASLLVLAVLLGGVLASIGSTELVRDELAVLADAGDDLARDLTREWPRDAIDNVRPLRAASSTLAGLVAAQDAAGLTGLLRRAEEQDLLAVLDPEGQALLVATDAPVLADQRFRASLRSYEPVARLLDGSEQAGGLIVVDGCLVALGGVAVPDGLAEDDPATLGGFLPGQDGPTRFVVLSGRIADDAWASSAAGRFPGQVAVEVAGQVGAVSGQVAGVGLADIVAATPPGRGGVATTVDGAAFFATSHALRAPGGPELGRLVTARSAALLDRIERAQTRRLFLLTLVGAALAAAAAAAVTGRLVAPVRRLTDAAAAVREGDLDVRTDLGGRDELGTLGRTFDGMTSSLAAQSGALREAADEQARLRGRLEALTASMRDALVAVDADGKVVTFNPAAERLVGRDVVDVLGRPLEEVLRGTAEDGRSVSSALAAAARDRPVAVQLRLVTGTGIVPAAATAAPVHDRGGALLGRVFVLRDVTRETELERMKTEFLANVSHELRTPLTPIKGYAELLAKRDVDADAVHGFADRIVRSVARLERVVDLIVEFAALDSGRMRPEPEPVPADAMIGALLADWRDRVTDREFSATLTTGLPALHVDAAMLRRALDELVDNALKFSPGGQPITISAVPAGRAQVAIAVTDRGVGMHAGTLTSMFAEFVQGDGSASRRFDGLGLGLALVGRIAERLGGDVDVSSQPGEGTTVRLLLPTTDGS
ncbi:MAG: ATP-binding protein [Egibacteraceae bacterium]